MQRIIELIIDEEHLEDSEIGIFVTSIVDKPATGATLHYFNEEIWEDIKYEHFTFTGDHQKKVIELANNSGIEIGEKDVVIDITQHEFSTIKDILKGIFVISDITENKAAKDPARVYYRYSGRLSENSRPFCRAMFRANRLYTRADIAAMDSINSDFAPQGTNSYSIWDFKGGVFCRHYWREVHVFKGSLGNIIIDKGPVDGLPGEPTNNQTNKGSLKYQFSEEYKFKTTDEQIIVGALMIPDIKISRLDEFGEYFVYFTEKTIKTASEKFFKDSKQNITDINHDGDLIINKNNILESWIIEDTKNDKSKIWGFDYPVGTWMVKYKVRDKETWEKIKKGELKGFSIAGRFLEREVKND